MRDNYEWLEDRLARQAGTKAKNSPNGAGQEPSCREARSDPVDAFQTFVLPLPPAKCSPNARGVGKHWAVKARAVKSYRETCGLIIKRAWGRQSAMVGMVTINLDFYLCRGIQSEALYLPRDQDNALSSAKAAIDSLRDAGVIRNDSKKYVTIGRVNLYTKSPEHQGRTELVLTLTVEQLSVTGAAREWR